VFKQQNTIGISDISCHSKQISEYFKLKNARHHGNNKVIS